MLHMVLYGPTLGFPFNLLPLNFNNPGVLVKLSYYTRKATELPIWSWRLGHNEGTRNKKNKIVI